MTPRISFCTVCMNRLHHLKETLPKNIQDNISYPEMEFIVMDYNSSDGLYEWIKEEMSEYVEKGILVYYRYKEADYFDRSHSRNLMFKLASGEIICNVDADNFIGKNFAQYISNAFNEENDFFLVPDTKRRYYYIRDALGRFCARKSDFISVRGYDEKMSGYGFEDDDLYERLVENGTKEVIIRDLSFLNAIRHGNDDRINNEFFTNYFESLYIHFESAVRSEVIIFYKNGSYHQGIVVPNKTYTPAPAILESLAWAEGTWIKENGTVKLFEGAQRNKCTCDDGVSSININGKIFHKIDNAQFRERLPYDLPLITNYSHFLYNKANRSAINQDGFGKGKVFKNLALEEVLVH